MGCRNFEILTLRLDGDERLLGYHFEKSQCSSVVGDASLLLPHLKGLKAKRLMTMESDRFCQYYPASESWQQYLYFKHFIAIKSALEVLHGNISGGAGDFCTITSIQYGGDGTILEAQIEISPLSASTSGCMRCKECNSKRPGPHRNKRKKVTAPKKKAG